MKVTAHEVTVRYPGAGIAALHQVSMALHPAELLVVAGPNGSGKSTLFRALLGLHPLTSGFVTIADRPMAEWRRDNLVRVVGAVSQREEPVFPQRVADAVMLGRWARLGALAPIATADRVAVQTAMHRTGIEHLAERRTDTLSGGEWQLVRLARALAGEPRMLLLDEPGTALDLAHEMSVLEVLRALADDGLGILAITHHLNAAAQYADRVLLMDRGQVAATGRPGDVLTEAIIRRVFDWPVVIQHLEDGSPHIVPLRRTSDS